MPVIVTVQAGMRICLVFQVRRYRTAKTRKKAFSVSGPSCGFVSAANIVKGERNGKAKTKFSDLPLPSRLLYSENTVKGERDGRTKTKFSGWALPGLPPVF